MVKTILVALIFASAFKRGCALAGIQQNTRRQPSTFMLTDEFDFEEIEEAEDDIPLEEIWGKEIVIDLDAMMSKEPIDEREVQQNRLFSKPWGSLTRPAEQNDGDLSYRKDVSRELNQSPPRFDDEASDGDDKASHDSGLDEDGDEDEDGGDIFGWGSWDGPDEVSEGEEEYEEEPATSPAELGRVPFYRASPMVPSLKIDPALVSKLSRAAGDKRRF